MSERSTLVDYPAKVTMTARRAHSATAYLEPRPSARPARHTYPSDFASYMPLVPKPEDKTRDGEQEPINEIPKLEEREDWERTEEELAASREVARRFVKNLLEGEGSDPALRGVSPVLWSAGISR